MIEYGLTQEKLINLAERLSEEFERDARRYDKDYSLKEDEE